jgi:hypothetical protein
MGKRTDGGMLLSIGEFGIDLIGNNKDMMFVAKLGDRF